MMNQAGRLIVVLSVVFSFAFIPRVAAAQQQQEQTAVEVFQVLEMPITTTDAALVKTKNGYLLKCVLANSTEFRQLGLRYSLAIIDSMNATSAIVSRNEGFRLAPYETKTITFKTPLRLTLKGDERFVLMVEQVVGNDYVWDVLKSKDSLAAYIEGDYSVMPKVLRVSNHVDSLMPIQLRRLF
ncbi:MAG TPA: hypothetical protein VFY60_01595 [Pyrinomonadaceae bacterium]|nr:hypothetical protein [Pyrinomonadaceae bacterium]